MVDIEFIEGGGDGYWEPETVIAVDTSGSVGGVTGIVAAFHNAVSAVRYKCQEPPAVNPKLGIINQTYDPELAAWLSAEAV